MDAYDYVSNRGYFSFDTFQNTREKEFKKSPRKANEGILNLATTKPSSQDTCKNAS